MAIQLFYGVAMGLSIFTLLGVVMMTFCDKYKCRYLMYFSCVLLFFFALLGFFIAIIFSIFVPLIYWSCDWLSVSFSSAANFNTNMGGLITDASTRNYISPCLKGGSGDLMAAIAPSNVATLNNLRDSLKNTSSFNSTSQVSDLNTALNNVDALLTSFTNGVTPDITDSASITTLVSVANRNGTTTCPTLNTDSFVMSYTNTSFTACAISGGAQTNNTTCGSKATFETPGSCVGCIDTSLISNAYYAGQARGQWLASLNLKYVTGTNTCAQPFANLFGNVWDNYYFAKVSGTGQNFLTINSRWNTAKTNLQAVITTLPGLGTNMTNITNSLSSAVDGITNPTFGLVAGLNCLIIGEDI